MKRERADLDELRVIRGGSKFYHPLSQEAGVVGAHVDQPARTVADLLGELARGRLLDRLPPCGRRPWASPTSPGGPRNPVELPPDENAEPLPEVPGTERQNEGAPSGMMTAIRISL